VKKILLLIFIFISTHSFDISSSSIEKETNLANQLFNNLISLDLSSYLIYLNNMIDRPIKDIKMHCIQSSTNCQNVLQECSSKIDEELKRHKRNLLIGVPVASVLAAGSIYAMWKILKQGDLREAHIKDQLARLGATDIGYEVTREYISRGIFSDGYTITRKFAWAKSPTVELKPKIQSLVNQLVNSHNATLLENIGFFSSFFYLVGSLGVVLPASCNKWYNLWAIKKRLQWHLDKGK